MESNTQTSLLVTIWRQRWLVIVCVVLAGVAAAVISKSLPRVYSTSAKLLVVQSRESASFDAIQAAQVTARTYSDVLSGSNIATLVARRLGDGSSPGDVSGAVSISPIPETQLLEIHAEAPTPQRAKTLADGYAAVFIDYARTHLARAAGATVTLADSAPLSAAPSKPRPKLYVLLAICLAIPLSFALAFLRERLDSRLRSPEDVEDRLGIPVLARVPRRSRSESSVAAFDESFRLLRAALHFATAKTAVRSLAVTSSWEGEGKTTTALNLAVAAAEAGQRVLLVDADIYRANLIKSVDVPRMTPASLGLSHYLAGMAELDDIIYETASRNLLIVPSGPMLASPSFSAQLESERGARLLGDLSAWADMIVVDCPPLGPRADASVLAARAEGVLLVVDMKVSTERRLSGALRQLRSVDALLIGAVLNRDSTFRAAEYEYAGRRDEADQVALPDLERTT